MEFNHIANMNFQNVFEVLCYTVKALKKSNMEIEIADYLTEAIADSNYNLLQVSDDYLSKCFYERQKIDFDFSDYDSEGYLINYGDSEDPLGYLDNSKYYWEDDVDNCCDEDEEAYEGFSTCKKTYWDSVIDDTEDNENAENSDSKWYLKYAK